MITTWELLQRPPRRPKGRGASGSGAMKGWPDLGVFWNERVAFVELKRERGGYLSPEQKAVHQRLAAAGFPVAVCRSVPMALAAPMRAAFPGIPEGARSLAVMSPCRCTLCGSEPVFAVSPGREDELAAPASRRAAWRAGPGMVRRLPPGSRHPGCRSAWRTGVAATRRGALRLPRRG